jgi:hypothetical protein
MLLFFHQYMAVPFRLPPQNVVEHMSGELDDDTVVTWNVLSDVLTSNKDVYDLKYDPNPDTPIEGNLFSSENDLRNAQASDFIVDAMKQRKIICLQEATDTLVWRVLQPLCADHGYRFEHERQAFRKYPQPVCLGGRMVYGEYKLGLAILFPMDKYTSKAVARIVAFKGPEIDEEKLGEVDSSMAAILAQVKDPSVSKADKSALGAKLVVLKKARDAIVGEKGDAIGPRDRTILCVVLEKLTDGPTDGSAKLMAVATVHVPCNYTQPLVMEKYARCYRKALKAFMDDHINSKLAHSVPVLLCGDMNSQPDSLFHKAMLEEYVDALDGARGPKACTCHSFTVRGRTESIQACEDLSVKTLVLDHAYASQDLKIVWVAHPELSDDMANIPLPDEKWPSDHYPICIGVRVPAKSYGLQAGAVLYAEPERAPRK